MKKSQGFTLSELLIVVAIMAVLIGICFPAFGGLLEKSREATDAANIRTEYAHILTDVINGEYDSVRDAEKYKVQLVQTEDGWQTDVSDRLPLKITESNYEPKAKGIAVLTYNNNNVAVVNLSFSQD